MSADTQVGVIGLGRMGGPIAANLVRKGSSVSGYDLDPARTTELEASGGIPRASVAGVAAQASVILTLLPSAGALDQVVTDLCIAGTDGRGTERLVVAEMSTLAEATKRAAHDRLAEAGITMLDCPVSGTAVQAAAGDLVVYASGDDTAIERCLPTFERLGRGVHRLGAFGMGTRTKLVANLLVAVHIVSAAEALALASAAGLDLERTLGALIDGAGTSRMLEVRGPMMARAEYDPPSMTLRLFQKDEDLIHAFAGSLGVAVPLFDEASRELRGASAAGHAEHDTAAVFATYMDASSATR